MARAVRALLAAFLVAAQFAAGSLAAQTAAQGVPCPVHAALAASEDHASTHHGHDGAAGTAGHTHQHGHEQQGREGDNEVSPHSGTACCAACLAAMITSDILLFTPDWHRKSLVSVADGFKPGELPSTDPPPRNLL
jgi:hypothetical protein